MRFHWLKFLLAQEFIFEMEMRHKLWTVSGCVGGVTDKVFQQLPHLPPAIALFHTTVSLC